MLGAIAGDIIGSVYEAAPIKRTDFPLFQPASTFTDDTVLTVAVADCLLNDKDYTASLQEYGRKYPDAGYGGNFMHWIFDKDPQPYNSWGNGSAMRVSPIGWAFDKLDQVLEEAQKSAAVTHNHPEGIKGAQATATAIFLARKGNSKSEIKAYIEENFGYDLGTTLVEIRPQYHFDVSCQGSVPQAIIAFLESKSFKESVRLAVSLGGDSDTQACIAGGIAEAFYGSIPADIAQEVVGRLPKDLRNITEKFKLRNT
ncbi:ADP-ribosylglycohydrolase [Catalinimonas alkaloidigena]|uniref:ADP-ribosylglycohydrolase family protein n=1 Tax=Catalinimonas alkaloidigena TaxID=1075417 RepID=UPI00240553D2|nr:ADP-ribosylglycohydrolase family protein [Catalinimonas alkaloidigena]MDF9799927.1 ADP-ribosylglycohydrolase [Catalinimonas alkaloidigena]